MTTPTTPTTPTTTLYGYSDDMIEIEGQLGEEFYSNEQLNHVAFSDGTLASIEYVGPGFWKINLIKEGTNKHELSRATDDYSKVSSDRLTIYGDLSWAVCGGLAKTNH